MTETKKYSQSAKNYFNIVLKTAIRKRGWLYALLIILGFGHIFMYVFEQNDASKYWIALCFTYPLFVYFYLYWFAHHEDKRSFLSEKQLFFSSEKIKIVESDGTQGEFPYTRITSIRENHKQWLLYISKSQFIYVPKHIFNTNEDFEQFEKYLIHHHGESKSF